MALETQHRPQHNHTSTMHYMPQEQIPHFTNPWTSQQQQQHQHQMNEAAALQALSKPPSIRTTGVTSPYIGGRTDMRHMAASQYPNPGGLIPNVSSVGLPAYTCADMGMSMPCSSGPAITTIGAAAFMPSFSSFDFTPPRLQIPTDRRLSQPSMPSSLYIGTDSGKKTRQASLTDNTVRESRPELDFTSGGMDTRGMLMSQPIRGRNDSIHSGYHSNHSASSSVSSTHSFPNYYNHGGSIDSSVTDYSDGYPQERSRMVRSSRPHTYLTNGATVPNQMMTTFSSKIASSAQKKHKCKVCDKRFTRPSSLQTHTYSHTGEKRMFHRRFLFYSNFSLTFRQPLHVSKMGVADVSRSYQTSGDTKRCTKAARNTANEELNSLFFLSLLVAHRRLASNFSLSDSFGVQFFRWAARCYCF